MHYMQKNEKIGFFFIIVISAATASCYFVPVTESESGTVIYVYDADTILFGRNDGTRIQVRLLGIDAPECYSANSHYKWPEFDDEYMLKKWAWRGKEAVTDAVLNRTVRILYDQTQDKKDKYGRHLAYVTIGDTCLNAWLLENGFARTYTFSTCLMTEQYTSIENMARSENRGIWGDCCNESGKCILSFIHYDAQGNDHSNLTDEYVIVKNTGIGSLALDGYTLSNSNGHIYTFPCGTSIGPDSIIRICTGEGIDDEDTLYWGKKTPMWKNSEGEGTLSKNGATEDIYAYGGLWLYDKGRAAFHNPID